MKLFISWSGEISGKVARILRDWLPNLFPNITPYMSTEDIGIGMRWSENIASELETSNFGILCVTRDNILSPWLNFEAGALSKSIRPQSSINVCPFLFGLEKNEIVGPIQQFQAITYNKDDFKRLVITLNNVSNGIIKETRLDLSFDKWWPDLNSELEKIHPLTYKKIIWAYETPHLNADSEIKNAKKEGFKTYKKWHVNKEKMPADKDCDILIYVFGKSENSKEILQDLIKFANSLKAGTPLIIYTRYASGDARLSEEEFQITQEYDEVKISNMPDSLFSKLKEIA